MAVTGAGCPGAMKNRVTKCQVAKRVKGLKSTSHCDLHLKKGVFDARRQIT